MRDIPRVWEVNWALPAHEDGSTWASYDWLLDTAEELGASEVSVVASTYQSLGDLDWAIGRWEAAQLRVAPHSYLVDGITVRGVTRRGHWYARGPVLVAWADDQVLAQVEGQRPDAIAAVAQWPDDVAGWRSIHTPRRIGQIRAEQEAEFDTAVVELLDPIATDAIRSAAALVNENHATLSTTEREWVAGALIALRDAGSVVGPDALRTHLMTMGWNGPLIDRTVDLAARIADGQTPRHRRFSLGPN